MAAAAARGKGAFKNGFTKARPGFINLGGGKAAQKKAGEQILPKVKTYEQARNQALEILGDLGPHAEPNIGKFGLAKDKIVGRKSADDLARWRLEWDPKKGPHINVEDFRKGKMGNGGKKIAIPFEGTEETVKALLKHLNN